jgi:hypothetical protein
MFCLHSYFNALICIWALVYRKLLLFSLLKFIFQWVEWFGNLTAPET